MKTRKGAEGRVPLLQARSYSKGKLPARFPVALTARMRRGLARSRRAAGRSRSRIKVMIPFVTVTFVKDIFNGSVLQGREA